MKIYTISELEKLNKKEIKEIIEERNKLCTSLIKNALVGKTIESDMGNKIADDEDSIIFPIKDITYNPTKDIFLDEKRTAISLNIYLDGYACKTKKEIMYEDESIDFDLRTLFEENVVEKSKIYWGLRRNQGLDYINMELLFPTPLINPDIITYQDYMNYCKSKKATPTSKEKKKKELDKKLELTVQELKFERFNLLNENYCYVPEDKEELMKFIEKANKKTFDKAALIGVVKKHSENKEIISAVLAGLFAEVFEHASEKLKDNKEFISYSIDNNNGNILEFASERLRDDKKLLLNAIKSVGGQIMRGASDRLKNDKKIALIAIKDQAVAYQYISEELKNDEEIISTLIEQEPDYFKPVPVIKHNKELLLKAFEKAYPDNSGLLLIHTSDELKNDKQVALAAIKCNEKNLEYIGDKLKEEIGEFEPFSYLKNIDFYKDLHNELDNQKELGSKRKMKM